MWVKLILLTIVSEVEVFSVLRCSLKFDAITHFTRDKIVVIRKCFSSWIFYLLFSVCSIQIIGFQKNWFTVAERETKTI